MTESLRVRVLVAPRMIPTQDEIRHHLLWSDQLSTIWARGVEADLLDGNAYADDAGAQDLAGILAWQGGLHTSSNDRFFTPEFLSAEKDDDAIDEHALHRYATLADELTGLVLDRSQSIDESNLERAYGQVRATMTAPLYAQKLPRPVRELLLQSGELQPVEDGSLDGPQRVHLMRDAQLAAMLLTTAAGRVAQQAPAGQLVLPVPSTNLFEGALTGFSPTTDETDSARLIVMRSTNILSPRTDIPIDKLADKVRTDKAMRQRRDYLDTLTSIVTAYQRVPEAGPPSAVVVQRLTQDHAKATAAYGAWLSATSVAGGTAIVGTALGVMTGQPTGIVGGVAAGLAITSSLVQTIGGWHRRGPMPSYLRVATIAPPMF